MTEYEKLAQLLPDSIKRAVSNYQTPKLASALTGMGYDDFTLDKIAFYLGARGAARRKKWASITDGILSLHTLQD